MPDAGPELQDRNQRQRRLLSYLRHPVEDGMADDKAAVAFAPDSDFTLNLVRHIIGMPNAGYGLTRVA